MLSLSQVILLEARHSFAYLTFPFKLCKRNSATDIANVRKGEGPKLSVSSFIIFSSQEESCDVAINLQRNL